MQVYTINAVDGSGTKIVGRGFSCPNDSEALDLARCMLRGYPMIEVWLGTTLVGRLPSDSGSGQASVLAPL